MEAHTLVKRQRAEKGQFLKESKKKKNRKQSNVNSKINIVLTFVAGKFILIKNTVNWTF